MIYVKMGLTFSQLPGAMEPACADRVPAWSWLLLHFGSLYLLPRTSNNNNNNTSEARGRGRARAAAGSSLVRRAGLAVCNLRLHILGLQKGVQIEMAPGLRKVFYETPIVYNYNVAHRIRTRLTTWSLAHAARTHCETWSASVRPGGQLTNRSWRPIAAGGGRPAPWPPFWAAEPRM